MAISGGDGSIILTTKVDESGLKKGLGSMGKTAKSFGVGIAKSFAVIGAAAATTTVAITKMAVSAYADYEQLIGGVETLFKGSAQKVIDYANDAFATAGMSANQYMEQVIGISAMLIKSTGDTEKAADVANMAITDMADNVNKMGTDMTRVQMAYQGFARQQYVLLDNLAIGYGGTKQEMERLLRDAQAITGVKYDINNLADVYSAIHAIQTELGITGTTAKEAEKTITGSANMMKAAWQNVLSAIAGGGDLDRAINNLVYSIQKYFENIVPIVERSLVGIGRLIEQVAPMLVQNVASALIQSIPSLVNAIYQMIIGLAKGIWEGIKALFTGGSGDVTVDIKTSVGDIAIEAGNASTEMEKLGDATEKAGKQAKKFLAPFDELNNISKQQSLSSNNADYISDKLSTDISTTYQNEKQQTIFDNILEKLEPIKNLFMSGFWEGFGNADFKKTLSSLKKIKNQLDKIIKNLKPNATEFNEFFIKAFGEISGSFFSIGTSIANNLFGGFEKYLTSNSDFIQKNIGDTLNAESEAVSAASSFASTYARVVSNTFGGEAGEEVTSHIIAIFVNPLLSISNLGSKISSSFMQNMKTGIEESEEVMTNVMNDLLKIFSDLLEDIENSFDYTANKINDIYDESISPLLDEMGKDTSSLIKTFYEGFEEDITPTLQDFADQLDLIVDDNVKPLVDDLTLMVKKITNLISIIWTQYLSPFVEWMSEMFSPILKNAIKNASDSFISFLQSALEVTDEIVIIFNDFLDFFTGIFTQDWQLAWESLKKGFKDIANSIVKIFEKMINKMIDGINGFLSLFNNSLSSLGGFFGQNWHINTIKHISLPRLAQGAVIPPNREFLAVLGDQKHGTNIEAPLDTIKQAVAEVLAQVNVGGGGFNGRIEVPVIINGREIARAVRESEQDMGKQTVFGGFANAY